MIYILIGGVSLDINPISRNETGSLSEYLTGVENYLAEKKAIVAANSKDRQKDKQREAQRNKLASEIDI